jgi:hypothetical protein
MNDAWEVHNHGPSEGRGTACREYEINYRLVGACKLAAAFSPVIELTDDHELCETQIGNLIAALGEVQRSKNFDMLPHALKDRINTAVTTRGNPHGSYRGK